MSKQRETRSVAAAANAVAERERAALLSASLHTRFRAGVAEER